MSPSPLSKHLPTVMSSAVLLFSLASVVLQLSAYPTGSAQHRTTYTATYLNDTTSLPDTTITGTHVVTHVDTIPINDVLSGYIRSLQCLMSSMAGGPGDSKKVEIALQTNLNHNPHPLEEEPKKSENKPKNSEKVGEKKENSSPSQTGEAKLPGHTGDVKPHGQAGEVKPPGQTGEVRPPGLAGEVKPPGQVGETPKIPKEALINPLQNQNGQEQAQNIPDVPKVPVPEATREGY